MSAKVAPDPGTELEQNEVAYGLENHSDAGDDGDPGKVRNAMVNPMDLPKTEMKRRSDLFTFANAEYVKAKVRQERNPDMQYNVMNFYHETGFFQRIARHNYFENITLSIIVINALWISIDTDGNTADTIIDAHPVYIAADVMFFTYFTLELFIRFMAFERKCNCAKDGWFVFDTTLVALYGFDPFIIGLMAALSGGGGLDLPTAVLRLFRLARLSRLVRMLRSLPELMIMIKGMVTATTSVGYCLGLLMLITYVFAIAIRNVVPKDTKDPTGECEDDCPLHIAFFSSVPEAMHNLIVFACFCDEFSDFILPIKEQSTICFLLTWIYVALSGMTVMNMLIGVLCEVISAVAASEKEAMLVDKVNEEFGSIVQELDTNSDGVLTWEEFEKIMDHPGALQSFERVGVDAAVMVELSEDFFFEDGEPVAVEFDEFMDMVLDLRGGQECTIKDVMRMGTRHSYKFVRLNDRMSHLEESLDKILYSVSGGKDGQMQPSSEDRDEERKRREREMADAKLRENALKEVTGTTQDK